MAIVRPTFDGTQLHFTADSRSIEPPMYSYPVMLNENFYVVNATSNTNGAVRNRGFNCLVNLSDPGGTAFTYIAENGEELTWTIAHNGIVVLSCWGVTSMASGILIMEWFV